MTSVKKQLEREKEIKKQRREDELGQKVLDVTKKLYIFPGSKELYESLYGSRLEVIELGRQNKGLMIEQIGTSYHFVETLEDSYLLAEAGIEGIIEARPVMVPSAMSNIHTYYYGIPVRRKDPPRTKKCQKLVIYPQD